MSCEQVPKGECSDQITRAGCLRDEIDSLRAHLAEAQKKAEALDRLEEMRGDVEVWNKTYRIVLSDRVPMPATKWHPKLIEAINEAWEKVKP